MDKSYISNSSTSCVPQVDLRHPKKLHQLQDDHSSVAEKTEIKRGMFSKSQLMISDFNNFPIGNVTKLVPNSFTKEKYVLRFENLQLKQMNLKNTPFIRIPSMTVATTMHQL